MTKHRDHIPAKEFLQRLESLRKGSISTHRTPCGIAWPASEARSVHSTASPKDTSARQRCKAASVQARRGVQSTAHRVT